MTVTTTENSISYAGNGTTTDFAFPFVFFEPTDLVVTLIVTATNIPVSPAPVLNGAATYDYTVTGDVTDGEYASGGTVTFNTAPPATHTVLMQRAVPATQTVTLIDNTKFPAATVNVEFDKLTILAQQSAYLTTTALQIPSYEAGLVVTAVPAASRANQILLWDGIGNLSTIDPASLIGGSVPGGPAGGDLGGAYPNPTVVGGTSPTFTGTVTSDVFSGIRLEGGIGNGGWLRGYNNANALGFKWDGNVPWINVDNATQLGLTTQVNARQLNFYTPAGGPTTWGLGAQNAVGTINYTIFADAAASDERIKENIAPTAVDALDVLQRIPITQFDIKADAAAFLRDPVDPVIGEPEHIAIGIVAQQIGQHIPDADVIVPQPEGSLLPYDLHVLNNGATLPYLIRAIQQLLARVAALEAKEPS